MSASFSRSCPQKKSHWSHDAISGFRRSKRFFQASPVLQWDNQSAVGLYFCHDLFPLPSAYHLFIVKVFPGGPPENKNPCGFFRGEKAVFHGDLYLNWTWNSRFFVIFEATKGPCGRFLQDLPLLKVAATSIIITFDPATRTWNTTGLHMYMKVK